ncbi:MAG: F0F1 ATP synthase subunit A [Methyloligellaceae bacterium]
MTTTEPTGRILGIPNRWFVLLFIVLGGVFGYAVYPPVLPHVQLPAEALTHPVTLPVIGEFALTNTIVATLISDVILLLIGFGVYRASRRAEATGNLILTGFSGAMEALLEALWNLAESTAGKWARRIFPIMATIVLLVLINNWLELIPGVDSIGRLEPAEHGTPVQQVLNGVYSIVPAAQEAAAHGAEEQFSLVAFVRAAPTDLNFTVALALIAVFMTQVIGVQALGSGYFSKFWNTKTLFSKPMFGAIDFAVGLLEVVSELSKILSFAFRLFGNIFAGTVLLFVIGTLVPAFAQSIFLLLEFFVGLIQAIIFGMLTLVFMYLATLGHGDHEEEHHG